VEPVEIDQEERARGLLLDALPIAAPKVPASRNAVSAPVFLGAILATSKALLRYIYI
jgi:hypothetical protein